MFQDQESALYADGGVGEKGNHAAWDPYLDKATFFRDKKRKIGQLRSCLRVHLLLAVARSVALQACNA